MCKKIDSYGINALMSITNDFPSSTNILQGWRMKRGIEHSLLTTVGNACYHRTWRDIHLEKGYLKIKGRLGRKHFVSN